MGIPEIVLSDQDLDALEEIKAKADAARAAQEAKDQGETPELGDEEIDLSIMEDAG